MSKTNRRNFVKASAVAAGAAATMSFPTLVLGQRGANDRIRVGLVGLGGRMHSHVGSLAAMAQSDNVEIAAICDCDQSKLDTAGKSYPELANLKLKTYTDQRKLFDDKSIDAISFSTQDHWHALQTIWACQAGKHVYVEKPPTWCIWEGRKMVEAARKYGCMVQVGTQNRSSPNVREGIQKLQEGVIGKLYMGRAISYKLRGNLGKHKPVPVPAGLNWDGWVGPAKMVEYSEFHHRRWYWIENFASGDAANQLVHDVDKVRWGLGLKEHPVTVMCMGDRYVPGDNDDADTPEYAGLPLQMGRQQRAGDRGESSLVHQQRSADARQVSVHGPESVRRRNLLRQRRLHDHSRLRQLLHVPRREERAGTVPDGQRRL